MKALDLLKHLADRPPAPAGWVYEHACGAMWWPAAEDRAEAMAAPSYYLRPVTAAAWQEMSTRVSAWQRTLRCEEESPDMAQAPSSADAWHGLRVTTV